MLTCNISDVVEIHTLNNGKYLRRYIGNVAAEQMRSMAV
jgi:hypothetical protein